MFDHMGLMTPISGKRLQVDEDELLGLAVNENLSKLSNR